MSCCSLGKSATGTLAMLGSVDGQDKFEPLAMEVSIYGAHLVNLRFLPGFMNVYPKLGLGFDMYGSHLQYIRVP